MGPHDKGHAGPGKHNLPSTSDAMDIIFRGRLDAPSRAREKSAEPASYTLASTLASTAPLFCGSSSYSCSRGQFKDVGGEPLLLPSTLTGRAFSFGTRPCSAPSISAK